MSNELVFHIGMPKTGSTALQRFLYENGDVLKQYRWSYPNLKNELPNMQQCRFLQHRSNSHK